VLDEGLGRRFDVLWGEGRLTVPQLADLFRTSESGVWRLAKERCLPPRKKTARKKQYLSDFEIHSAEFLWRSGKDTLQIAERLKTQEYRVYNSLFGAMPRTEAPSVAPRPAGASKPESRPSTSPEGTPAPTSRTRA
jgi:hypothetical protein